MFVNVAKLIPVVPRRSPQIRAPARCIRLVDELGLSAKHTPALIAQRSTEVRLHTTREDLVEAPSSGISVAANQQSSRRLADSRV
jgi:hypothetical protein